MREFCARQPPRAIPSERKPYSGGIVRRIGPAGRLAFNYLPLNRPITTEAFEGALAAATVAGLHRLHRERPGSAVARIAEL